MRRLLVALVLFGAGKPVLAQPMDHSTMDHSAIDHSAAPQGADERKGTDQPPGSAAPPPVAHDRAADRYWDPSAMARAETVMMAPPVSAYTKVMLDIAERQFGDRGDGYRWEGEAWAGDVDRFVVKSQGEGTDGDGIERAEVQALYGKALDPWWTLQAGVRQDLGPQPRRTWATLGLEGRARYQFEVQAAAFLSDRGQLAARLEGAFDSRITQRLVLQPRVELELAAQDMPDQRIGAGLSSVEAGLRLRYEIVREFAPYVGVSWTWATGRTARLARTDGRTPREGGVVGGIRFWF